MSVIPYLKLIGTLARNFYKLPGHYFRSDEFSLKGNRILRKATEEAFPNENALVRYHESLKVGDNGGPQISQGINRILGNSLYPHNFSSSQIAVLTLILYTPLPADQDIPPETLVRIFNANSGVSDIPTEEISLALEQLVENGHIILSKGSYKAAKKLDDLLD